MDNTHTSTGVGLLVLSILLPNNINEPIPDVFWRLEGLQELSVSL